MYSHRLKNGRIWISVSAAPPHTVKSVCFIWVARFVLIRYVVVVKSVFSVCVSSFLVAFRAPKSAAWHHMQWAYYV